MKIAVVHCPSIEDFEESLKVDAGGFDISPYLDMASIPMEIKADFDFEKWKEGEYPWEFHYYYNFDAMFEDETHGVGFFWQKNLSNEELWTREFLANLGEEVKEKIAFSLIRYFIEITKKKGIEKSYDYWVNFINESNHFFRILLVTDQNRLAKNFPVILERYKDWIIFCVGAPLPDSGKKFSLAISVSNETSKRTEELLSEYGLQD